MILLIVFIALFFAVMGLVGLIKPEIITATFDIKQLTENGRSEVRAVYGGFGLAIAGILFATFWFEEIRPGVLICVAAALFGMVFGRIVSIIFDRKLRFYPSLFFVIEIILAAMLLVALYY